MTPPQSWSIVVFSYNEAGTLLQTVREVETVLETVAPGRSEVIIVDDGSRDDTPKIVAQLEGEYDNIRSVRHPVNLGIGKALLAGYDRARYENLCAVPGDGQFDPRELIPFAHVAEGTTISFFRAEKTGYSGFRRWLTTFNRRFNHNLLGIDLRDVNWVKIYKTASLPMLDIRLRSSLIESEICAKLIASGHQVIEAPSVYRPRRAGVARAASLKSLSRVFLEMTKLVWAVTRFKLRRPAEETPETSTPSSKSASVPLGRR